MSGKFDNGSQAVPASRLAPLEKCLNLMGVNGRVHIGVHHQNINRAIQLIAQNYCQPFKLDEVVKASQMSRRGFYKAFQKHVGTKPAQLLRQIRIEKSKRLLIGNDLRLKEIARLSGFPSLNSFCVTFKQVTGVAPKQFQRQVWLKSFKANQSWPASKTGWNVATPRSGA